jgi:hypothetical protein
LKRRIAICIFLGLSTLSKIGGYFEKVGGEWQAKRG